MKWERLKATPHYGNAYRARVPGGWLVLADTWARHEETADSRHYDSTGVGICFYPDQNHEWTLADETASEEE
ncbi:MAG: hypothetical protein U9Q74_15845 [Gemmatimonadota bacterium]|nr:hypothetical protein [Gemmatimonadota bacterium]